MFEAKNTLTLYKKDTPVPYAIIKQKEVVKMKLRIVVEPDEDVYVAYCPELPGCVTYGKTEEEARKNIIEAVELYLRPSKEELSEKAKVFEVAV